MAQQELSVEEKIARCIAPIKAEFVVPKDKLERAADEQAAPAPAPPAVEVKPKQSKRQQKKEAKSHKPMCHNFLVGRCNLGDSCRFGHDLEGFVKAKGPDLVGQCPFSSMESCPYGIGCRFLGSHASQDPLQEHAKALARANAAGVQGEGSAATTVQGQEHAGGLELPVASCVQSPLNALDKNVQHLLWKNRYDFTKADDVLRSMGLKITFRAAKAMKTDKGPSKGQQEEPGGQQGKAGAQQGRAGGQQDQGGGQQGKAGPQQGAEQQQQQPEVLQPEVQQEQDPVQKQEHMEQEGAPKEPEVQVGGTVAPAPMECVQGPASAPGEGAQGPAEQDSQCTKKLRLEGGEGKVTSVPLAPGSSAAAATPSASPAQAGSSSATDARNMHVETPLRREEKKVVDFRNKTILAPLTTVGNLPFRRICKQFGADVTVGEMALATNLLQGQASEWALLKRHPSEDIFGVQIAGGFPDSIARTCQLIDETCPAVDFVDINCGCPIDIVCDRGAGSALLLRPRRLEDIARAADRAMSLPLTIKTRKGYYDDADVTHTFVKNIRSWGPIALTLHGRTRQQRYSKLADWDYITRCAEAAAPSKLQLIGNGDVLSFTDWNEHMRISGDGSSSALASCMIGRGALIKPWLFQEIKEQRHIDISASERLDMLKSFSAAGLQHWGSDTRGVETTRKFLLELLSYLHRYIPVGLMEVLPQKLNWRPPTFFGRNDLETLFASDSPADWIRISEMLLGKVPPGFTFTPKHKSNSYSAPANGPAAPPTGAGYEADDVAEG
uniref:tRNA-dihydrouridine(47) synthase [NAD(P)(+)] n=1 Tax=Dunaliella tertiolecta TaxID=3047 RepID=A0A7S3VPV2_DUNTE|mmetsp:Transcript_29067/g.78297  ORF Transcript_29067/g.78297 Transcript_29067/m.78297 type:complete len:781 (-) Transcript_29067:194-2536(-)|eukprot:CAMPEP_0202385834 /NCGR_PEP_ID=MMETSP1127-20130417/63039_1 /ASSEMBLY_ACC=CAM_ASM_000462 /TAXON_ID=3047 /ORGANISM="Dunaliella tertiolecta, Strain CCMP1320" /LENGTH=780 /DNA_ID=CAMNT_0048986151 /DNA_START=1041 /DNA_END=3383 /DNA_ORIENTATION=-